MERNSVISLSSGSWEVAKPIEKATSWLSVISLNTDVDNVGSNFTRRESTPSVSQKVSEWMNSCEAYVPFADYDSFKNRTCCIRYDFDKSVRLPSAAKSCIIRSTALLSPSQEAVKKSTCNASSKSLYSHRNNGHVEPDHAPLSPELYSRSSATERYNETEQYYVKRRRKMRVKNKANGAKPNRFLPLPPKQVYTQIVDFDESMRDILKTAKTSKPENGIKRQKLKHAKRKFKPVLFYYSLRSRARLRNNLNPIHRLRKRKKSRKKLLDDFRDRTRRQRKANETEEAPNRSSFNCEIVSVHFNSDDENIDLKNFVDDMLELDKMSEEHKRSVILSRIFSASAIANLINKQPTAEESVQRAYKIFSDLSKSSDDVNASVQCEHNYASVHSDGESKDEDEGGSTTLTANISLTSIPDLEVVPVSTEEVKSLHRSLTPTHRRKVFSHKNGADECSNPNSKSNHFISISKADGAILRVFYQDHNLVVAQQRCVSFWTQTALGNILGAQNMWIPKGKTKRIALNTNYVQKDALEMVICTETTVAYVELWTKEHKSELREVPLADVFVIVYFWRLRQNGLDKKALQLQNIKGTAADVHYCILRSCNKIVVSWREGSEKCTKIHSYHLASDFQTVASIREIRHVEHYVSSLHNIEDCDDLVMGCGENKVTLWNTDYGYVIATVDLLNVPQSVATHWVKCDRGFLFAVQECEKSELRLIAINGLNCCWKILQNYNCLPGFTCLKGVCIENGILVAYYAEGILCWNAQSGKLIVEEAWNNCEYISCGNHVIVIVNENIVVKHSLSHLMTAEDVLA